MNHGQSADSTGGGGETGGHPHRSGGHPNGSGGHPHSGGSHPHSDSSSTDTGERSHPHGRDYSKSPLVVTWEVTQACDLACDHCRAEADPERSADELTTEEGIELFEQVAEFSPEPFMVLSGGDPLKRPDIFELLEGAVDVGVTPSITPATTPLLDRETLERFAEIGVGRVALSLDGATPQSHDGFRGENGTYQKTMEAARWARELGLSIQINTTVTAQTVDDLPKIADIVEELDAAMWEVFFLVPVGRGEELQQLSPNEARELMKWLYRRSQSAPYRVITVEAPFYRRVAQEVQREQGSAGRPVGSTGAGNGFVFVSHTGEVRPSGFLGKSAGNVRETPLPELYQNADLMQRLRDRNSFSGPCGACPMTDDCGGSRSRAYAAQGNPFGTDPLCPWAASRLNGAHPEQPSD